ncbi:MAG: 3-oxoacyl-[acyl-carrier-protein] reductase [Alphaproteobacteria bacterium]|nr:3-oxoacyl-[acyl-carrier-protein] reductase [Alphaproteobacteria bacterium]
MFDLHDKSALVTGATGGIGEAIARALHGAGATVTLSGTRTERLEALAGDLASRVHIEAADLSDLSAGAGVDTLAQRAAEAMGSLHILVNNAGITADNLAMRMKDEEWSKVLHIDLDAVFRLSRSVLRGMLKQRAGRIINITSIVGVTGNPGQVNYAAAKAGMIGMSKALAQEVAARGITVNCIAPGFITTDMTANLADAQRDALTDRIPAGRLGTPGDIGAAAIYLASDEAAYLTGQTIHINGGLAMI